MEADTRLPTLTFLLLLVTTARTGKTSTGRSTFLSSGKAEIDFISYFSTKSYVVGTQKNWVNEMVVFSTQNTF